MILDEATSDDDLEAEAGSVGGLKAGGTGR